MAHRRAARTFHKKTMKGRKAKEERRIAEEREAHPVVSRNATEEELAAFRARKATGVIAGSVSSGTDASSTE